VHLRVLRRRDLYVRLPVRDPQDAIGVFLRGRLHLRPRLRVRARRTLRLHDRLAQSSADGITSCDQWPNDNHSLDRTTDPASDLRCCATSDTFNDYAM
jgi:hypothetical protein